jgi:two-component system chemotaxis sensor kinase CheA
VFTLTVPLSTSSFRGVLVKAGDHSFVFAMSAIKRVLRVPRDSVKTVRGRDTIRYRESIIPLIPLASLLGIKGTPGQGGTVVAVVLETGTAQVAFTVDEIMNELEVVLKPLVRPVSQVRFVEAVTIIGDGRIVPILSRADLLDAVRSGRYAAPVHRSHAATLAPRASILVAEDSVTARMLLKNILESAGYRVTTAVDGLDALTNLRNGEFDLLVSDVEMPRMDGFELTAKIRGDKKLAELPVVLVTARDAPQDIERGIDVGANGYVVKGSFNQTNLLDVIEKLV